MKDSLSPDASESQAIVVERTLPHAPEKVWRVLTQSAFIEEWLQKNDFRLQEDHCFTLRFDWGVVEGRVCSVEPYSRLSYTWVSGELDSLITWTLTPTATGTHLRMEQTGFRPDQPRFYHGARAGWPRLLTAIEEILNRIN